MVVAPGFIDMLGQSELTILVNPHLPSKIFQGITTEFTGEGASIAPLNDRIIAADTLQYQHYGITPDWRDLAGYFTRLEKQGMGINLGTYVGATQVRRMIIGDDNRAPSPAELDQMKALVRTAMQQGAVGVSTSLQYAPAPYAKTDELIALASEAARFGASTPPICAMKAITSSTRWTKPCESARGENSSRDLAHQSRWEKELGTHAGYRRQSKRRARFRRRSHSQYLRLSRVV
jgi:N-acyl-D-aspartate/D-glutamate deacylase